MTGMLLVALFMGVLTALGMRSRRALSGFLGRRGWNRAFGQTAA